mgnify:CR=1 FL=1
MIVVIRVALYFLFGALSGTGWLHFDQNAGTVTVYVDDLSIALVGIGGTAATFFWSRIAKARGGKT